MAEVPCDFVVLTVVDEAHRAAQAKLENRREITRNGRIYDVGQVQTENGPRVVVVDRVPDQSNIPAALTARSCLQDWLPRGVIVADVAGGFSREDLGPGDVVFAKEIPYYEHEKETPDGDVPRYYPILPPTLQPREVLDRIAKSGVNWNEQIESKRPDGESSVPKVIEGPILCGERLLSNPYSPFIDMLAERYPKALAVEMESHGVGRAMYDAQREEIFAQFAVVRGISDIVDDRARINQETRDEWRRFASEAAVAVAFDLVRRMPLRPLAGAATGDDPAGAYLTKFRSSLASLLTDERTFPLELHVEPGAQGASPPSEHADVEILREELTAVTQDAQRVVIYGPSGAGKSRLLKELASQLAAGDEPLAVLVDLKAFGPEWRDAIPASPVADRLVPAVDAILSASIATLTAQGLESLIEHRAVVLMVDGLNEVPEVGERMLLALNEYVRQNEDRVRLIVTDRSARHFYKEQHWTTVNCRGVPESDTEGVVDEQFGEGTFSGLGEPDRELLRLPFFLDEALRLGDPRLGPRASAMRRFIDNAGLSDAEVVSLSEVAYCTYMDRRSMLSDDAIANLRDLGILDRGLSAGIIEAGPAGTRFSHQLYHQFLASNWIASRRPLWTTETLDAVTADTASLDAVGMTLSLVEETAGRDEYLRIVYDWNWRGAIRALREAEMTEQPVSPTLETAVLAMAAEKLFDPVAGTSRRVQELLAGFGDGGPAASLRTVDCLAELIQVVQELEVGESDQWYKDWLSIFTLSPDTAPLTEPVLARVSDREPLVGWTAANVIRRFPEDGGHAAALRVMFYMADSPTDEHEKTVRWRVVHALGRWPSRENASLLQGALADPYIWVRYGAIRSLVEMAALTATSLRASIIDDLRRRVGSMDPEPESQVAWAAMYRGAEPGWVETVRPLLKAIYEAQPTDTERQLWQQRIERFNQYVESGDSA